MRSFIRICTILVLGLVVGRSFGRIHQTTLSSQLSTIVRQNTTEVALAPASKKTKPTIASFLAPLNRVGSRACGRIGSGVGCGTCG